MVTIIKKGIAKKDIEKIFREVKPRKKLDAKKYSGIIKLGEDPLEIQKKLRDEWE
ncbi:MAG: hypothetical protein ACXWEY_09300 [Bacteroidia bacterium]